VASEIAHTLAATDLCWSIELRAVPTVYDIGIAEAIMLYETYTKLLPGIIAVGFGLIMWAGLILILGG
jgi:hypothetical protein